jgi:sodium transport system permease protein
LAQRGLDPELIEALDLVETDLATPQTQAAGLLNMSGYFLIFSIFIGGMYLAIDSTAGERERASLEPLLLNPIDRRDLLLGKLLATLVFTFIAAAETLMAFGLVFNLVPLDDFLGLQISLDAGALVKVLLISLPIMPLAASLQLIIASFTRSFKEAQNYLSLLPLAPALPGMFLAFLPVKPSLGAMLVPTYGQQLLINQVMREEEPRLQYVLVSAASTLLVAGLLIALAVRLYRRERLVFGR